MIFLILLIYALTHSTTVALSTYNSLIMFGKYLLPALFFYMVLLDVLCHINIFDKLFSFLFIPFRLFKIRFSSSIFILITSILVGNPTNAKTIIELYESKKIDKTEANYLLGSTHFMSIGFSLIFINMLYPGISHKIILSNVISNLIIMIISKNKGSTKNDVPIKEKFSFDLLLKSLKNTINILLIILSMTLFFGIIIDILINYNVPNFILGFIEITKGITLINIYDNNLILAFSSAFLSFGGLCVHLQVYSIIKDKLSYKGYLFKRIIASIISFCFCLLI